MVIRYDSYQRMTKSRVLETIDKETIDKETIDKDMPVSPTRLRNILENFGTLTFISMQILELLIDYCH